MADVAVIGAGWAGLTAATRLASRGYSVVVFEKSRGPGGRSATRRQSGHHFDHGAQYLTARSEAFQRRVEAWRRAGLLAVWQPDIRVFGPLPEPGGEQSAERLVAVPGMNGVLRQFAAGLDCRYRQRVSQARFDEHWELQLEDGSVETARSLVLTAPPRQSAELLGVDHALHGQLNAVSMRPCWALMLAFEQPTGVEFDAAFVNGGALAWLARNSSKPGRSGEPETWVVHASADWSERHLELEPDDAAQRLFEQLGELDSRLCGQNSRRHAHRWRYSLAEQPLSRGVLALDAERLVVAGDWCAGSRIEGAWTSGVAAARRIGMLL